MTATLQVETISFGELGPAERADWKAWVLADPALDSPYFHPEYAEVAAEFAPGAALAVLRRDGRVEGFLPYQRRGGEIQPIGAPLTDYHGPIVRPGAEIDLGEVTRKLGADIFCFTGLARIDDAQGPCVAKQGMAANLEDGFEAYMAKRQADHPRFFKTRRRHEASLVRDHGPLDFSFGPEPTDALDWIIDAKRTQYRRTGQHDIFACGWTERVLRRLCETATPDFGPRFAVLRSRGKIIAAEMSLAAAGACHLWFPAYDPAFSRYGPGNLMTLRALEAAAAEGARFVDFGPGGETYKAYYADPRLSVAEGRLIAKPWRTTFSQALAHSYGSGIGAKLGRRLHVVSACETNLVGWTRGLASAAASVARIRNRAAMVMLATPAAGALAEVAELLPFA